MVINYIFVIYNLYYFGVKIVYVRIYCWGSALVFCNSSLPESQKFSEPSGPLTLDTMQSDCRI